MNQNAPVQSLVTSNFTNLLRIA